eukprot:8980862-Pyramimonas_sp.AAC.1
MCFLQAGLQRTKARQDRLYTQCSLLDHVTDHDSPGISGGPSGGDTQPESNRGAWRDTTLPSESG